MKILKSLWFFFYISHPFSYFTPIGGGFECDCHTHNRWILNLDTGLCSTYVCDDGETFCMNEGVCRADTSGSELNAIFGGSGRGTCQCSNYDLDDNCEIREYS